MNSTEEQIRQQLSKAEERLADAMEKLFRAASVIKPFADGLIGLRDLTAAKEWMREHGNG